MVGSLLSAPQEWPVDAKGGQAGNEAKTTYTAEIRPLTGTHFPSVVGECLANGDEIPLPMGEPMVPPDTPFKGVS